MCKLSSSVSSLSAAHFITPLLQNLSTLYSFLLSNPIYFAYFLFFSPYLYKILSFLSPLLICISLVIFCLLTLEKLPPADASSETLQNVLETSLDSHDIDIEAPFFEYFEYLASESQPPVQNDVENQYPDCVCKEIDPVSLENRNPVSTPKENCPKGQESRDPAAIVEEEEPEVIEKTKIVVSSTPERCGSMRIEKEWKRTLACKLYEERKSGEGGEGMDLLWEIHEVDAAGKPKVKNRKAKAEEKLSKAVSGRFKIKPDYEQGKEEEDEEEEEEDMKAGQVCCLQALKFSTGKMNLGIRGSNLVKFSKALKGIGMLMRKEKRVSS